MPKRIFICKKCSQYTLSNEKCPHCGAEVKIAHPPKFSPEDKYQKYRIPLFKKKFE